MNQGQSKEEKMSNGGNGVKPVTGNGRKFKIKKGAKNHFFEADADGGDLEEVTDKDKILEVISESEPILEVYSSSPL
jgi:hypothetical protein